MIPFKFVKRIENIFQTVMNEEDNQDNICYAGNTSDVIGMAEYSAYQCKR